MDRASATDFVTGIVVGAGLCVVAILVVVGITDSVEKHTVHRICEQPVKVGGAWFCAVEIDGEQYVKVPESKRYR